METLTVDNPYTLENEVELPYMSPEQVEARIAAGQRAARAMAAFPMDERQALAVKALEHLLANQEAIARDITRQMGKPLEQAKSEFKGMKERVEYLVSEAPRALSDLRLPPKEGFVRSIVRRPLGLVFQLPAWNYPLMTATNALFAGILSGNAVLLKHSPRTPTIADHFAAAFEAAGAPEAAVTAIHCTYEMAERIAADRRIAHVAFTGSVLGGRKIYAAVGAGESFADVGLELGGNDAAYVASDADLDAAVATLVDGACYNAGQSCCAIERVYVAREHYERFLEAARSALGEYRLGDPMDGSTTMGPIAQPAGVDKLRAHVADAKESGGRILIGGTATRIDGRGRFFEPTLIADASQAMEVMREESFGPLLPVAPVDSDDEAVLRMNDSRYGLTAAVFTKDLERATRLAGRIEAGTVFMNRCDYLDPALAWTGVKDSGKGSTLSPLGFLHLTRPQSLHFRLG